MNDDALAELLQAEADATFTSDWGHENDNAVAAWLSALPDWEGMGYWCQPPGGVSA